MRLLSPLVSLLVLAACGGGSGGGSRPVDPVPNSAVLMINSSAGVLERVEGELVAVSLERPGGELTGNLMRETQRVVLTDPLGSTDMVEIDAVPDGVFVAAHMLFVDGSMTVSGPLGTGAPLLDAPALLRVNFDQPLDNRGGGSNRVQVQHSGDSLLQQISGGRYRFTPIFQGGSADVALLRAAAVRVTSVDAVDRTATGVLGDLPLMLKFDPATVLIREPAEEPLGVDAFLDGLEVGAVLLLDGVIDGDVLLVASAVDLEEDPAPAKLGTGRKSKMLGVISALDEMSESFGFDVLGIQKAGRGVPVEFPIQLQVDAGDARVKFVPRRGLHRGLLAFDALAADMIVEVEWFDAPIDGRVTAQKVNVRRLNNPFAVCSLRGVLVEVESTRVLVEQEDGTQTEVLLSEASIVVRSTQDSCGLATTADLNVGDEVLMILSKLPDGVLLGQLIRAMPVVPIVLPPVPQTGG